jgi:spore maturation protein CgeB
MRKANDSIFLAGQFSPGALGLSYKRAFEAIGVRISTFDLRTSRQNLGWLMRNRLIHRLTIRNYFIRSVSARAFNQQLETEVLRSGAQVLFVLTLEFVFPETLQNLRQRGVRVVSFYPDNPFPPHYNARPETLAAARETDLCLIWSEKLVRRLQEAGVSNPAFLPFAWDPEVFPYQGDRPQGIWPGVLFLGGWDRQREVFLEKLARQVPLRIYGPGYWGTRTRPFSRVRRCWQGKELMLADAAQVIRESAICLNVLRRQHIANGEPDGMIMRHFEVPGAGGFLLSTRGGGATTLFPEGDSGEYFSGVEECAEKINKYMGNTSARRDLSERAHALIAARHQYRDRALEIMRLLDDLPARG